MQARCQVGVNASCSAGLAARSSSRGRDVLDSWWSWLPGSAVLTCSHVGGGVGDDGTQPVPGARQLADLPVDTIPFGRKPVEQLWRSFTVHDARQQLPDRLAGQSSGVQLLDQYGRSQDIPSAASSTRWSANVTPPTPGASPSTSTAPGECHCPTLHSTTTTW